jgi:cytidylate kinase
MFTEKLVPNIEHRLSTWVRIQEGLKKGPRPEQKPTITISRQFGAEAFPLAEALKDLLEKKTGDAWTIFDKSLIEKISSETSLSEQLLTSIGEASKALEALATMIPGMHTHSDAFKVLTRYVMQIALDGNAIIVGRGGAVITQHLPHCFHFRLEAPLEHRIRSIQERLNIPYEKAKKLVIDNQKISERFIEDLLNSSVADTRFYHAVFNSSKSEVSGIAGAILCLAFEN